MGSGRTGCQQNCSPRRQGPPVPPKASNSRRLDVSPEARTSEILCKPNAGTKSPVDDRFIRCLSPRREALFLSGCWPVDRRLFVSVNLFHARHVREEARTSEIPCKPNAGTKPAVDNRLIRGLSAGRRPLFVPGCGPVSRRPFVSVNPFHARHVREQSSRTPLLPFVFRPIFDPLFGAGDSGGYFGLRSSKIKNGAFTLSFGTEDRGWGFYDLRSRNIVEPPIFNFRSRISKNTPSSFFDPKDRRTPSIYDLRSRRLGRRSPSAPWCFNFNANVSERSTRRPE